MAHLSDGTLRRMYDEPLAVPETARGHYATCADCQGRFTGIAADARQMAAALAVPAATVDAGAAHRSLQGRLQPRRRFVLQLLPMSSNRARRTGLVALIAASLALLAVVSPFAQDVVNIFEPAQVQQVTLTQASLAGFPDLSHWGTVAVTQQPELKQASSAADAQAGTGLPLMHAGALPAGTPAPQFATVSMGAGSFTFDKAKADAYAVQQGAKAPPLPAGLNGSRLDVTFGPAEVALYGGDLAAAVQQGTKSDTTSTSRSDLLPQVAVAIAKAPKVSSTGASVADIKAAIEAQPGVSSDLKKAIDSIGDPTKTLPIPVLDGMTASDTGSFADGTRWVYEGDNTLGGVIFIRGGNIYLVAGSLTEQQALAIANTL